VACGRSLLIEPKDDLEDYRHEQEAGHDWRDIILRALSWSQSEPRLAHLSYCNQLRNWFEFVRRPSSTRRCRNWWTPWLPFWRGRTACLRSTHGCGVIRPCSVPLVGEAAPSIRSCKKHVMPALPAMSNRWSGRRGRFSL